MEEEGVCMNGNGRHMGEEVYWNNFKSMRFFQSLSGDFLSQLMIPKKFSENMGEKLPQMVVLKGPGGSTWKVQLTRASNNNLFFRDGWRDFVKAHHLRENDLLMFKYKRDSCFKVWVLDGKNKCEHADSYFVTKSISGKVNGSENSQTKRKTRESSVEVIVSDEDSDSEGSGSELAPAGTSVRKSRRHSVNGSRTFVADGKFPSTPNIPNRRPPSEEEKERALQMAQRALTSESFYVVMRATNIAKHFRLCIPAKWATVYLARKNQDVELQMNEKRWVTRFNDQHRAGGGVLVSGWYHFARDNYLQESDVCLFKLSSQPHDPAVVDVVIFRAGPVLVDQTPRKLSPV